MASVAQIIKYEGDNTTFIWKSPLEDFNTTTQLIVHESQEAIFLANGQALDLFGPGRHTLTSQNIPFLKKLFNIPTDGETPFHCEVYFINKTEQMAIKWGTDSKVQYLDPVYNFPLEIGASGEMTLRVEDSRKLLVKIVGTETTLNQSQVSAYFRAFLMVHLKPYIAQSMKDKTISIFEVDARLKEFSDDIHERLTPDFADYGIALERFFVTTVVKPDGNKDYEKFKELHFRQYADIKDAQIRQQQAIIDQETQAAKMRIEAGALADKRKIEGYDYRTERAYDVAEKVADNEGVGNFANMGMGLGMMGGMGFGVGAVVADVTKDALSPVLGNAPPPPQNVAGGSAPPLVDLREETVQPAAAAPVPPAAMVPDATAGAAGATGAVCANCGAPLKPDAQFCTKCGTPVAAVEKVFCAKCGAELAVDDQFCPKCGTPKEV